MLLMILVNFTLSKFYNTTDLQENPQSIFGDMKSGDGWQLNSYVKNTIYAITTYQSSSQPVYFYDNNVLSKYEGVETYNLFRSTSKPSYIKMEDSSNGRIRISVIQLGDMCRNNVYVSTMDKLSQTSPITCTKCETCCAVVAGFPITDITVEVSERPLDDNLIIFQPNNANRTVTPTTGNAYSFKKRTVGTAGATDLRPVVVIYKNKCTKDNTIRFTYSSNTGTTSEDFPGTFPNRDFTNIFPDPRPVKSSNTAVIVGVIFAIVFVVIIIIVICVCVNKKKKKDKQVDNSSSSSSSSGHNKPPKTNVPYYNPNGQPPPNQQVYQPNPYSQQNPYGQPQTNQQYPEQYPQQAHQGPYAQPQAPYAPPGPYSQPMSPQGNPPIYQPGGPQAYPAQGAPPSYPAAQAYPAQGGQPQYPQQGYPAMPPVPYAQCYPLGSSENPALYNPPNKNEQMSGY